MVPLRSDGVANVATAIVFVVVDSLAVVLRILSKSKTKHYLRSDDWWILGALAFFIAWAGQIIYSVVGIAETLNVPNITDVRQLERVSKILWVSELFFPFIITCVKISVLSFYRIIFSTRRFRLITYAISTVCVLWLFAGFWVVIFQCRPVRAVYDVTLAATAHCIPFAPFVFTYELINALIDVFILVLPVVMVRKLKLQTRQKLQVMSVFLMGGFVLITCVLRMVYSFDPKEPDTVPSYSRGILWSTIELGTALICACLPTYRPLLPKSHNFSATLKSWFTSILSSTRAKSADPSTGLSNIDSSAYFRFDHHGDDSVGKVHLTKATGGVRPEDTDNYVGSYPLNAISVESRIEVV